MSKLFWSVILQWSRFGLNAAVFLSAARVLSLQQFGAFATAFALIKLGQGVHKSGIGETVVIKPATTFRLHSLFGLSVVFGLCFSAIYISIAIGFGFPDSIILLGLIPTLLGVSAVSDGLLRKKLNIRALALRTAAAQSIAALFALTALYFGAGIEALVIFAVLSNALSAVISIILAGWFPDTRPKYRHMLLSLNTVLRIAIRDILNSGILPISQIAIGAFVGLPAAGAFQISTRVLSMLDALTLAPLRYIALPKFSAIKNTQTFDFEVHQSLRQCAMFACWVWFGLASSTTEVLAMIVGTEHALTVAPILQALIPLGLSAALGMTFTQALMGQGQTGIVLTRAIWTLILSAALVIATLQYSTLHVAIALSAANLFVLVWFVHIALSKLSLRVGCLKPIGPAVIAGFGMFIIVTITQFPLVGRIALGTASYLVILAAFQFTFRQRLTV